MSLTSAAPKKHRAIDRVRELEAENVELRAENGELRAMVINGDQHVTASELRGMQTATELDTARQWIEQLEDAAERVDNLFAETVAGMQQQINDLQRRLNTAVLAEHVVTRTQEIDTDTVRMHTAKPVKVHHLSVLDDTVQLPVTDPAHLPGARNQPQEVA